MLHSYKNGATSVILRLKLLSSASDSGAGLAGLTSGSAGLIISTVCDNEAAAVAYTVTGSTIETITTLGTYAAPTATKCRFKEFDATNHPGWYEIHFADARFGVASARAMAISVSGATNLQQADYVIQLQADDPQLSKLDVSIPAVLLDLANAIETGLTLRQALRLVASEAAGKMAVSGGGVTNTFRNAVADSKDRITATVDASGNRTAVTTDVT
jgi:hypothetical protein